jgi:hypothetical protein
MITAAWVMAALVGVVEMFVAIALYDWKDSLAAWQREHDKDKGKCYVCITNAPVMSFKEPYGNFCREHRAHWQLLHDLEEGIGQ